MPKHPYPSLAIRNLIPLPKINYKIKYELSLVFIPFTLSSWNDLINSKDTRKNSMELPMEIIDKKLENDWKSTTDDA